jgi:hypothetical protein
MPTKRDLREIWEAKVRIAREIAERKHPTVIHLDPAEAAQRKCFEEISKLARSDRDASQAAYLRALPDDPGSSTGST